MAEGRKLLRFIHHPLILRRPFGHDIPPHPTGTDLETMRKALTLSRLDIGNPAIKQAKMSEEIGLG